MARAAFGELTSTSDGVIAYRFTQDLDGGWEGVVSFPADDPESARITEGIENGFASWAVVSKARKAFRAHGEWPQKVAFFS